MRLLGAASTLIAASSAHAARAGDAVELDWRAPAGCPSAEQVRGEVDRLLGPSASRAPQPGRLVARATVTRAGTWRVRIETALDGVAGERALDGDSCAAVASAAALILAMTVDPEAVRGAAAPRDAPPPPAPPAAALRAELPEPRPADPMRATVRTSVLGSIGALPTAAAGVGFAIGVRRARVSLEVFGHAWGERFAPSPERAGAGGSFRLLSGGVLLCASVLSPHLSLCGGGEVDRVDARGRGVTDPGTGTGTWLAPVAGAAVRLPLGASVALHAEVAAAVPVHRPAFVLVGLGPVWRPPTASVKAGAGVALSF